MAFWSVVLARLVSWFGNGVDGVGFTQVIISTNSNEDAMPRMLFIRTGRLSAPGRYKFVPYFWSSQQSFAFDILGVSYRILVLE